MIVAIAKASLFDAVSENDFTLLEDGGRYFVSAANTVGAYADFLRAVLDDDGELFRDLTTDDVRANFLGLMASLAERWGDQFRGEILTGIA